MKRFIVCFITILFLLTNVARAQEATDSILESELVLVLVFATLTGTIFYKEVLQKDDDDATKPDEKVSLLDIKPDDAKIKPYLNMYNDSGDNKVETGIKFKF